MSKKIHYVSKIFQPLTVSPKNAKVANAPDLSSKSQKLLLENGLIRSTAPGCFALLPLAVRSLKKLENIIHNAMGSVDAYQMQLPTLTSSGLWNKTGRFEEMNDELFKLKDRHDKRFILSPTHEESITDILASVSPMSYRQLPMILYQITEKHRDEKRPQSGLLRARQFVMMDAYSFHSDGDCANRTYDRVNEVYHKIFGDIGVGYKKVRAASGTMGGSISHEWHYESPAGSDAIVSCDNCGESLSQELCREAKTCDKCGCDKFSESVGIEVGHTFVLGTKYSSALGASLVPAVTATAPVPIFAACYGLGLTRIMAAALEVLCDKDRLIWPIALAPFKVCIIGAKEGSKEMSESQSLVQRLCHELTSHPDMTDDVIFDDRSHLTIGKRCLEATRVGYPYIVIAGKSSNEDILELLCTATGRTEKLSYCECVGILLGLSRNELNKSIN